ncbi:MAG TPA: pentapeptide repeat-containing protein [Streptosporangiaceae bacterium]
MPDLRLSDDDHRPRPGQVELRADCGRCFGLCCVAPAFAASVDFAIDKPAGQPCPNLRPDFGCGIHDELRPRGFRGCSVYDCFGAGQQVAQVTFGGRDWREAPRTAGQMFAVFAVMRQLHELLWYLTEALALPAARPLHGQLREALAAIEHLTHGSPADLLGLDLAVRRGPVGDLLRQASELTRAAFLNQAPPVAGTPRAQGRGKAGTGGRDRRGADLTGADLTGARLAGSDLSAASLRGACLIAADLRGADLRATDLLGADLRDADLPGADLTGAIFLTQSQLDAARGGAATRLPVAFTRPAHWAQRG